MSRLQVSCSRSALGWIQISCRPVPRAPLPLGTGREGERDAERRPLPRPIALRLDPPAVVDDDPMNDRQPQAGPLPRLPTREEGFEEVLEDLFIHPTAVVGKGHDRRLANSPDGHASAEYPGP